MLSIRKKEFVMAFSKKGIAVSKPQITKISEIEFGTEKDGKFWDGEKWVSKEDFEKLKGSQNG